MEHSGTIIQIFATPAWGGGEQFVYDLTRRLLADGRRVELVSRRSRIIGERTAGLGTGCRTMPLKGAVDLWSALLLALLILRTRASVVHVHHFKDAFTAAYACLLSRLFGVRPRIVLTRHLVRRGKRGWLYGWLYGRIDRIAFVSELARREFLAGEPPVDPARLCVIHNSVPEPVAASDGEPAADLRRRFGIAPATSLLLFCGRLVPEKGCDVLLRACARLAEHDFALVLVGTGEERFVAALRETASEEALRGKVFFAGFVRGANRLLPQADLCVSPSVVSEAGSLTVLEAMQAGAPRSAPTTARSPNSSTTGVRGCSCTRATRRRWRRRCGGCSTMPLCVNAWGARRAPISSAASLTTTSTHDTSIFTHKMLIPS